MKTFTSTRGLVVMGLRRRMPGALDIEFVRAVAGQTSFLDVSSIVGSADDGPAAFLVAPVANSGLAAEALDRLVDWLRRKRPGAWFEFTVSADADIAVASRVGSRHALESLLLRMELPQAGHAVEPRRCDPS